MNNKYKNYKKLVSFLKKNLPIAYPVSVRRCVMSSSLDGECIKYNKKFFIKINKDLNENLAVETLIHEWAHARAWNHLLDSLHVDDDRFDDFSHDATWGVAYSEVYRLYQKLVNESYKEKIGSSDKLCGKLSIPKN
jgi:hypothetical protein